MGGGRRGGSDLEARIPAEVRRGSSRARAARATRRQRARVRAFECPAVTEPAHARCVSKITSLLVKVGALLFILFLDTGFSIDLQLIGGVIILQTLPSVALGLYTRWFHRNGLIAGWAAGMTAGLLLLYNVANPVTGKSHFAGSAFPLSKLGLDTKMTVYAGILALAVNLVVAALGTVIARAAKVAEGDDITRPDHYFADEGDPRVKELDLTH